jgi:hypothetical protein
MKVTKIIQSKQHGLIKVRAVLYVSIDSDSSYFDIEVTKLKRRGEKEKLILDKMSVEYRSLNSIERKLAKDTVIKKYLTKSELNEIKNDMLNKLKKVIA